MARQNISLSVVLATAIGCTATNADDSHWSTDSVMASTTFKNGIRVAVLFPPQTGCHTALFALVGNNRIDRMKFTIDGHPFNLVRPIKSTAQGIPYTGFALSKAGLRGLKQGSRLYLETDEGSLSVSLYGTAEAFNDAWSNCAAQVGT